MDQEFEDSSEEKLHNEVESHEQEGLGLHQDQVEGEGQRHEQGLGQVEGKGERHNEQGLDQGFEVQGRGFQGQEQDLGQGFEVQGRGFQCQGKMQGKGHLFGREKPVHIALGGGTPADVILWRNKQMSAALLASSTVIWLLFEWIGYHLIPFICHFLILTLATLFLWSNLSFYVHKSPLNIPEIELPQDLCMTVALLLRDRCNQAISMLWEVVSGKDLQETIFALWVISMIGSWFDFLTIIYITNVLILTMPPLYEKHEDQVDSYALKAKARLKRLYSKLDEKVLQKLPKVPFISDNKQH
ncbi:reticulon-like protein B4 [Salvia splendens]|uniref:reticulon-like protein B4 n=1 Tax=Salvia splendens TaxID=180675 RepID=UPI001C278E8F|nr:reticulon-like protein B4 [Salvia splendens]